MKTSTRLIAIAFAAHASLAGGAGARDGDDFYRGKTLTIIVGSPAGGGYDTYARLIGRHIARHIPGGPAVVVQNMPGASGYVAASHVYNVAPKDGLTMATVTQGALLEPLLGDNTRAKIDPAEFGSVRDFPQLLNRVLGTKFKIVYGYAGNREITLAVDKGEVQGVCGNSWAGIVAMRPGWFAADGAVRVLVQEDTRGHPALNALGVPRTVDFARSDEQRQVMSLLYEELLFSRPYVMAPGAPAERVETIRGAFDATLVDPEFLAEAKRINVEIVDPLTGEELAAIIRRMYATPAGIVAKTRDALRD